MMQNDIITLGRDTRNRAYKESTGSSHRFTTRSFSPSCQGSCDDASPPNGEATLSQELQIP